MRFKEIQEGVYEDQETGLQWSKTFEQMLWQEAIDFCQNLKLGEHYDWRLPTRKELEDIIDDSTFKLNPATELPDTLSSSYWSSTTDAYNTDGAWDVLFIYGSVSYYSDKSDSYYVRAVRDGQ